MVVATFNQERALLGAFSVITNVRLDLRLKLYCQGHQADQKAQCGEVEGRAGAGQAPQHQPRARRGGQEAHRLGQTVEEGETGTIPIFDACLQ